MADGWEVLKTIDVTLAPSGVEVGGWNVLKTIDVTIVPSGVEVGGWNVLKTIDVTIYPEGEPPTCTPGETKCIGYDLYTCSPSGEWKLTEKYSAECYYEPPNGDGDGIPLEWLGIGALAAGAAALLIPKKKGTAKKTEGKQKKKATQK